jgi:hypothetical protein
MIGLTFFLHGNQTDPNRCDILVESYSDYTSSGHEAEIAEQIAVTAIKAMRLIKACAWCARAVVPRSKED